jgi:hypothetical protein
MQGQWDIWAVLTITKLVPGISGESRYTNVGDKPSQGQTSSRGIAKAEQQGHMSASREAPSVGPMTARLGANWRRPETK